jgi:hypothetical protein
MKIAIYENSCLAQSSRDFEFPPEVIGFARENRLRTASVPVQALRQLHNPFRIRTSTPIPPRFFYLAQRSSDQIFDQYRFLPVALIVRWFGLIIKTDGATLWRLELCKFAYVFSSNHAGHLLQAGFRSD